MIKYIMYGFDHITDMSGWDIFMVMTFTLIIGVVFTILWDKIKDNIGTHKNKEVTGVIMDNKHEEDSKKENKKEGINWANTVYRFRLVFAFIGLICFFVLIVYGFADLWKANDEYNSELEGKINENQQNEEEMSAYMSDIGLIDTGKTILISNDGSMFEYSVKYDIHTKLVYLIGCKGDIIPYMKNATVQYIWNIEKGIVE